MTKAGHVILGVATAQIFELNLIFTLIGAVLPDKDLLWGGMGRRRNLFNSHRGITHHAFLIPTLLALSYLSYIFYPQYAYYVLSFSAGYISHLLGDILTPLGIPYTLRYYPRLSVPLFRTGSFLEHVFVTALAMLTVYLFMNGSAFGKGDGLTGRWVLTAKPPFQFGCRTSGGKLFVGFNSDGSVDFYNPHAGKVEKSKVRWSFDGRTLKIWTKGLGIFRSSCEQEFRLVGRRGDCLVFVREKEKIHRNYYLCAE